MSAKISTLVILCLFILTACSNSPLESKNATELWPVTELYDYFLSNPDSAENNFKGKSLFVVGKAADASENLFHNQSPRARMEKSPAILMKGEKNSQDVFFRGYLFDDHEENLIPEDNSKMAVLYCKKITMDGDKRLQGECKIYSILKTVGSQTTIEEYSDAKLKEKFKLELSEEKFSKKILGKI